MPTITRTELDEALESLRGWLKPGDTVYTILRHVSRSGMQRTIQLVKLSVDGPLHIGYVAAKVLGDRYDRQREGIKVNGCGMDMGFHLVYNIGRALWPNGVPCTGEACLSNDHNNGDRDYTPHGLCDEHGTPENRPPGPGELADGCRNHWHQDGGYALKQVWL